MLEQWAMANRGVLAITVARRVSSLIITWKGLLKEDFSKALEDIGTATPFFEVVEELKTLHGHLFPDQRDLFRQAQAMRQSLIENAPFINFVLEANKKIHRTASSIKLDFVG
ncbi:hypothetical protein A2U01_0052417 [Trifolium medium]|uniref:Uncharacterized protein n=1 Tax=Trifolium medium TaxID=97028 RepID=A0A392R6Q1_9FABA|nr:hypothetical protein [Trifolium medium]